MTRKEQIATNPPTIVLVSPQMGENIGAAARAMGNFGLSDLRLVTPRDGWPNPAAEAMAAHAAQIVKGASIYDSLAEAIADCHHVYATSGHLQELAKPVRSPREWAANILPAPSQNSSLPELRSNSRAISYPENHGSEDSLRIGDANSGNDEAFIKTAILFGRESSGLSKEELSHAHTIIRIPVAADCPSLNLAQAVAVVGYEWFCRFGQSDSPAPPSSADDPMQRPATQGEIDGFFHQLEEALDAVNFWRVEHKKTLMWRNIRNLFLRRPLTLQEVQTLRGMVRSLGRGKM